MLCVTCLALRMLELSSIETTAGTSVVRQFHEPALRLFQYIRRVLMHASPFSIAEHSLIRAEACRALCHRLYHHESLCHHRRAREWQLRVRTTHWTHRYNSNVVRTTGLRHRPDSAVLALAEAPTVNYTHAFCIILSQISNLNFV